MASAKEVLSLLGLVPGRREVEHEVRVGNDRVAIAVARDRKAAEEAVVKLLSLAVNRFADLCRVIAAQAVDVQDHLAGFVGGAGNLLVVVERMNRHLGAGNRIDGLRLRVVRARVAHSDAHLLTTHHHDAKGRGFRGARRVGLKRNQEAAQGSRDYRQQ